MHLVAHATLNPRERSGTKVDSVSCIVDVEVSKLRPLVLIVEDEPRSAHMLAQLLQDDGCEVHVALDGAAAMGMLANGMRPDVIVADECAGSVTGSSVIAFARARQPDVPAFVVTGYPHLARERAHAVGTPVDVFTKPIAYDEFQRAVFAAARARRSA